MKQILLLVMAVVMVGCATYDWSIHHGVYTYDEAKIEFGPPDSESKLSNGGVSASWITGNTGGGNVVEKRILTFDENGKLVKGSSPSRRGRR